jgi:hypothetical protein
MAELADVHQVRGRAPIPEYHVKEQVQAEVNRAAVEGREPDLDNPPAIAGNQLVPVSESADVTTEFAPTPVLAVEIAPHPTEDASVPTEAEVPDNSEGDDGNEEVNVIVANTEHEHEYKDNGGY